MNTSSGQRYFGCLFHAPGHANMNSPQAYSGITSRRTAHCKSAHDTLQLRRLPRPSVTLNLFIRGFSIPSDWQTIGIQAEEEKCGLGY